MLRRILYGKQILNLRSNQKKWNFIRHSGDAAPNYRLPPQCHSKATLIGAEAISTFMWWWILWHIWHEPGHIVGEFKYPNAEEWSNKELGIPPD